MSKLFSKFRKSSKVRKLSKLLNSNSIKKYKSVIIIILFIKIEYIRFELMIELTNRFTVYRFNHSANTL